MGMANKGYTHFKLQRGAGWCSVVQGGAAWCSVALDVYIYKLEL